MTKEEDLLRDVKETYLEYVQASRKYIERNDAKLQEELEVKTEIIKNFKTIETKETDRLHKIILDMDVTISDLMDNDRKMNGFLDEYRATVENRDKTIEDLESKLSEKPDTIGMLNYTTNIEKVVLERRADDNTIEELEGTIEELKDRNIEDLHELYDLYEKELRRLKHVISARDLTIKSLTTMCQSSGTERNGLQKEIDRMEKVHANRKAHIHNLTSTIEDQKRTIDHFINCIGGLEAELSARKEDSKVLMEVVDIVKNDKQTCCHTLNIISVLLTDYHDAPEGSPETPIDDLYKVTVTCAFLEMP